MGYFLFHTLQIFFYYIFAPYSGLKDTFSIALLRPPFEFNRFLQIALVWWWILHCRVLLKISLLHYNIHQMGMLQFYWLRTVKILLTLINVCQKRIKYYFPKMIIVNLSFCRKWWCILMGLWNIGCRTPSSAEFQTTTNSCNTVWQEWIQPWLQGDWNYMRHRSHGSHRWWGRPIHLGEE